MNSRLKVSDFYKSASLSCIINIPTLTKAFFLQDWLFVIASENPLELHQFSLISRQRILIIKMPYQGLGGVEQIEGRICFFFSQKEDLYVYYHHNLVKLSSHFAPISAIIKHQNQLITGSMDMTIRRWNVFEKSLVQDNKLHILTGHKNSINCFLSVSSYLLSASKDKSVYVWKDTKIKAQKYFQTSVISMIHCKESQQLSFLQESNKIWVLSEKALHQSNKLQTLRIIQCVTVEPIRQLNEVDFSFLQIVGTQQIQIAQINLGTVMAKIKVCSQGVILASKCIRRLSLFAIKGQGVNMISF